MMALGGGGAKGAGGATGAAGGASMGSMPMMSSGGVVNGKAKVGGNS